MDGTHGRPSSRHFLNAAAREWFASNPASLSRTLRLGTHIARPALPTMSGCLWPSQRTHRTWEGGAPLFRALARSGAKTLDETKAGKDAGGAIDARYRLVCGRMVAIGI
jgi:hypothetical protein